MLFLLRSLLDPPWLMLHIHATYSLSLILPRSLSFSLFSSLLSSIPIRRIHRSVSKQGNCFVLVGNATSEVTRKTRARDEDGSNDVARSCALSFVNARRYFSAYFHLATAIRPPVTFIITTRWIIYRVLSTLAQFSHFRSVLLTSYSVNRYLYLPITFLQALLCLLICH